MLKNLGVQEPVAWARQVGKSVYLDVQEQEGFVNQMQFYATPRMVEVAQPLVKQMIKAHLKNLSVAKGDIGHCHKELDEITKQALTTMFTTCGSEIYEGDNIKDFLISMARPVDFKSPLTAKDRRHMPAGNGNIGSFPLPSPEGDPDRQPTPLERPGDVWSNTLHGECRIVSSSSSRNDLGDSVFWS